MSKKIAEILKAHGVEVDNDTLKSIENEHVENYRSIEEVQKKDEKLKTKDAEIENLNSTISELSEKASALEGSSDELNDIKEQFEQLKAENEKRKADDEEAARRASFEEIFNAAVGDREFVNSMTRDAILAKAYDESIKQAGVGAADILKQITDNQEGIWVNPQNDVKKMPAAGADPDGGEKPIRTLDDIRGMSPNEINARWESVSKMLSNQK